MIDLNILPNKGYDDDTVDETLNNEPFIGQTFSTFQKAYLFYNNYAKQHGFTVRKDRSNKRNDKTLRRDICCHREGKKRVKLVDLSKNQRNRGSIKCECNAHMRVTLKRSCDIFPEEWHVTTFVKDHNHELLSLNEMRFLPFNRIITPEDEQQILLYKEVGLNVRQIIRVMELQKQVKHGDLSFQEKDVHNLFAKVRRTLGDNDAMDLINYMESSNEKNNKFQYAYTIDEDMRLENIFWCHPQGFEWYEKFGDVVVFDTTYKVNVYDMPCAFFVGINNHGKTVLFATALLRNETVKTFTWLMKTIVAVMKKPSKTIITDQDPWMSEAIAVEMPTTKHNFCIWHITTKFSCWFAALLRTQYQNRCGDFYTLYKMTSIEEFEHSWLLVVSKYNLQKNNHVQGLYKIRKSWAPAYLRNYFFVGMKSTSRLESINAFIKRFVVSLTSLRDFVKQVDLAVEEIGIGEVKDKMSTTVTHASLKTKSPLEEQAYRILTPFAFNKFQAEFERASQYLIVCVEGNDFIIRYFDSGDHKNHQVFWDGHVAFCSCKNFEFWGMLCRHIFQALLHKDCFKIPPLYFPLRWSLDSFQSGSAMQLVSTNVSLTPTSIVQGIALEKRNNILSPPKSATKGRPKKRSMKGGKKLGNKTRNKCSICKELGHTKVTCDNKENNVDVQNVSSDKPKKKRQEMARDLGLNPVY